jgi:hypothetical protein
MHLFSFCLEASDRWNAQFGPQLLYLIDIISVVMDSWNYELAFASTCTYFGVFPQWHYEGRNKFCITTYAPHDEINFSTIACLLFTAGVRWFQVQNWMRQLFWQFTAPLQNFCLFTLQHHLPSSSYFCLHSCTQNEIFEFTLFQSHFELHEMDI